MTEVEKRPRKLSKTQIIIASIFIFVLIASGVAAMAFLLPKPDYVKLCLEDQAMGRVTDTSAGPNCDKALEAERQKGCDSATIKCEEE